MLNFFRELGQSIPVSLKKPFPVHIVPTNPAFDAFHRFRVSNPETVFDSKQIHSKLPGVWDEATTGTGAAGTWLQATASTVMDVDASTAGSIIRQTFRRFNYQPGKSQFFSMTGTLRHLGAGGSGLDRGFGFGDQNNGVFLAEIDGVVGLLFRTSNANSSYPTSGTPTDTFVPQTEWNVDKMDGKGLSDIEVDWTNSQIFLADLQWLGVGRVRCYLDIDGNIYNIHDFTFANKQSGVHLSTPNLPFRYWIENDGSYASAAEIEHICASIMSEGGSHPIGSRRYGSMDGTGRTAASAGTIYPLCGIRLKAANIDGSVKFEDVSILSTGTDDYEWLIIINPTLSSTSEVWTPQTDSIVDFGVAAAAQTCTGGKVVAGGYVDGGKDLSSAGSSIDTKETLGAFIDGTPIEAWLCVRPTTTGGDTYYAGGSWNEYS